MPRPTSLCRYAFLVAALVSIPPNAHSNPPSRGLSTHLVAGGDLLIHAAVKRSARHAHSHDDHLTHDGFATPFIGIKDVVTAADLAFANLEVPIAPDVGRPLHGEVFNAPASLAPALSLIHI